MGERNGSRVDRELVKALSHPTRVAILETLQGRAASPLELSREMNESLAVVSYHVKTLVRCGCLDLVALGCSRWSDASLSLRADITRTALEALLEDVTSALLDARSAEGPELTAS